MCGYLGAEWWNTKDLKEQRVKNNTYLDPVLKWAIM